MATSDALGFNMFSQMMQTMLNGVYNASSEQANGGSNPLTTQQEISPFTQLFNSSGNTTAGQQDFNTPPAMQFMSLMSQMMMAMMMFNPMGFFQMLMGMASQSQGQNQNQFRNAANGSPSYSSGGYRPSGAQNVSYNPGSSTPQRISNSGAVSATASNVQGLKYIEFASRAQTPVGQEFGNKQISLGNGQTVWITEGEFDPGGHSSKRSVGYIDANGQYGTRGGGNVNWGYDLDFGEEGDPIPAFVGGTVSDISRSSTGYGNKVEVTTPVNATVNGQSYPVKVHYAHLDGFAPGLKVGSQVNGGDLVGYHGNTGGSHGAHLDLLYYVDTPQGRVLVSPAYVENTLKRQGAVAVGGRSNTVAA